MSLTRFETALPDTMTIENAVRAMIEGDGRIKLPLCYETIGGFPIFEHLAECLQIMERQYDSALEYGTPESQEIARLHFEAMETIQRNAQLYREDLNNLADSKAPGFSPDTASPEDAGLKSDHRRVNRAFLVPWAYNSPHGVDIHGFHARQARSRNNGDPQGQKELSIPAPTRVAESNVQDWVQRNAASADELRLAVLGEALQARPEYNEGQLLFLTLAYLLDGLLTAKNEAWRGIVSDETDKTTIGFIINGRLNNAEIVRSVADQLPVSETAKDPTKNIKGYIKPTADFLMYGPDCILDFSAGQVPMAYRTLYGLARATWKAKTLKFPPDRHTVEYPPEILDELDEGLTGATPLTADELEGCLEEALQTTRGLYPAQES
jgi:hypothetical protein